MALFKGSTPRRREVRRNMPRHERTWFDWVQQPKVMWAWVFAMIISMVATLVSVTTSDEPRFTVGQTITEPIVPRVKLDVVDTEATERRRTGLRDMVPPVYSVNVDYLQRLEEQLDKLLEYAKFTSIDEVPEQVRRHLALNEEGLATLQTYVVDGDITTQWTDLVDEFLYGSSDGSEGLAGIALLASDQASRERGDNRRSSRIVIQHPRHGERERYWDNLFSLNDDRKFIADRISLLITRFPAPIRPAVETTLIQGIEALYTLDVDETEARREAAYLSEPVQRRTYTPQEVIIPAGTRLTSADVDLLRIEARTYRETLASVKPWAPVLQVLGRAGMIALITLMLWGYVLAYNDRLARNPMRGLALSGLMIATLLVAALLTRYDNWVYWGLTLPTVIAAMVLAIAYDRRFALAMGVMTTFLVIVALGLGLELMFITLVGMGVAVGQLREVRTRSKLISTGFWSGLAMAAAVCIGGVATRPLLIDGQLVTILIDAAGTLGAGLAAGILVQAALPWIEQLFKVTTAQTLKDLNDASHPLLRRLAQEAPGTYQHSLRIADMAESAANAIAADTLLCKVGAMYHDIGKINKPLYFVENQAGGPNRHDKLSPAMSLLIIVGHVKDGIEMAREYKLPSSIRHFIESHHGTTLVEYFYHAARQRRGLENEPAPSEFEFRYPGPKPQSREAAILMLADCVEGASRTLSEPSPVRFEQLVHTLAQKRLMDGQFDECNLTLQDVSRIEGAITKTLCAMYHGRIAYPSDKLNDQRQPTSRVHPAATAS